jgi:hypothetical protein
VCELRLTDIAPLGRFGDHLDLSERATMPNPPIYLEHDGRRQTREEWSREKNIPISTLRSRLELLGWGVARHVSILTDRLIGVKRLTGKN